MQKHKILVMDDESAIRNLSKIMLERHGFEVHGAETTCEALEKIKEAIAADTAFCVAILDLQMPDGKGGVEILPEMKAIAPNLKTIVSSGFSNAPEMEEYDAHGFDFAVSKPFRMEQLTTAVKTLCGVT